MTNLILPTSSEFLRLEPQGRFPKQDISKKNVPFVEYVMLDQDAREITNEVAARASLMLIMAHSIISNLHKWDSRYSEESARWMGAGISQYGAISGLLRTGEDNSHLNTIAASHELSLQILSNDHQIYIRDAYMDFCTNMPNLEAVITHVTEKTISDARPVVELALIGAAIQRKNEIDAIATVEAVELDRDFGIEDSL